MSDVESETSQQAVEADEQTAMQAEMQVLPRGGVREVGRSCFEVSVGERTYLVDCGIKQGYQTEYPLFRGLGPGEVDAVFLTHAHIDHIGALPVAEQRGQHAPIVVAPSGCSPAAGRRSISGR